MGNEWAFNLDSKIFTLIKSRAFARLKDDYPKIIFTSTDNNTSAKATFPCVYIHMLPGAEVGNDLENESINGVLCSIQIDVYTDISQYDTRKITSVIADEFKKMKFTINKMPEFDNEGTVYRQITRVRRVIGAGDVL